MPRKSRKNVGLIGLGIIGSRVAAGLRGAGFHVFVWNRTPKPAPNFLGSPAEVAELCDIIQIFVADAAALFDVLDQLSDTLTAKHLIVCNSTVGPEATIEAARLVEQRGASFLDAPFTGSKGAADKRDLVYYLGGDDVACLRAKPVLEATSKAIVRIGEIGHAATIKVVTNMIAAVSVQTLAEALAIVQKAGLDPEVLAAAMEHNACRSGTMELKLPKMIQGDYEPHFSLKHMFKDVQLGIHVANALDIEIPATTVTAGVMYGALNQGWAELDFSALYKVYEPLVKPAEAAVALPSAAPKLQDLDRKHEHYPEMIVEAPARPASGDSGPLELAGKAVAALAAVQPEKKLEAPRLADVLSASAGLGAFTTSFETTAPPLPPPAAEKPAVVSEPPTAKADEPTLVVLKHAPAAISDPPISTAAKDEAKPVEGKSEAPAMTSKDESGSAIPTGLVLAKDGDAKPAEPKIVDLKPEELSVSIQGNDEPKARSNGAEEAAETEAHAKPFNFVRRWFVARGGG